MLPPPCQQLATLSDLLAARREAILLAWRAASHADPEQMTGRALTIGQFLDHIPEILDAFEFKLRSQPGGAADRAADLGKKKEEVKHGLHRWQQGYRLKELMSECGQLQICLFDELRDIAAAHPELSHDTFVEAYRQLLHLINDTISESAVQYERMQQAEAAGRMGDLVGALADLSEIERRRATLLHQVVHDLNSDVMGVSMAATRVSRTDLIETDRVESAAFLQRAVEGLNTMLGELMDLARLEAGQEDRDILGIDIDTLITELCDSHQPFARERNLFLMTDGVKSLNIEGDAEKIRRIAKNLIGNALKYTRNGGVTVSWGEEKKNWWLMIKDTGPGMKHESGGSMIAGLHEATASAKESDEKSLAREGRSSQVLPSAGENSPGGGPALNPPGEGIGLSIVKRLCELLDASLEIASSAEIGTTFRVVFPRRYDIGGSGMTAVTR
jgi:signal transduction histidine kinase